jgi:hypothetical protein
MREFADYQVVLLDEEDHLVGAGQSVPFRWDGRPEGLPGGWDDVLTQAMIDRDAGRVPTAAAGLGVTVAAEALGRGMSYLVLGGLRDVAAAHGLAHLVVPVRPNRKFAGLESPAQVHARLDALHPQREPPTMSTSRRPMVPSTASIQSCWVSQ